jgi:hypothetical protein
MDDPRPTMDEVARRFEQFGEVARRFRTPMAEAAAAAERFREVAAPKLALCSKRSSGSWLLNR